MGPFDKGLQILRPHSRLFEVGQRGEETLGKAWLLYKRGKIVFRRFLRQELPYNATCNKQRERLPSRNRASVASATNPSPVRW